MNPTAAPELIKATATEPLWTYQEFLKRMDGASENGVSEDGASRDGVSVIGHSEKGRPILGGVFGSGPCTISLMAGAHADEPVGPNTLYRLVLSLLDRPEMYARWLEGIRLLVIPHLNPDGDEDNRPWIERWPSLQAYAGSVRREPPGRDLEFGFPSMRVENRVASAFWSRYDAPGVHISLHGMGFSEGFLLLVNREKADATQDWRAGYARFMAGQGLYAHDHNRGGEKGFDYLGPGFSTTPRGEAMRRFFLHKDQRAMAARFHDSSMEHHLARNANALCLVTEFPLFLLAHSGCNGRPETYMAFKEALQEADSNEVERLAGQFGLTVLQAARGMYLQWQTVCMAREWLLGSSAAADR